MANGNGHRRMNFYHKKSSRMGRSSSMERPGKLTSSLASAELIDYKLTDDILYENKMKEGLDDDSHDTILLNLNSKKDNNESYFNSSQKFLGILKKTKNYFEKREEMDKKMINNNKYIFENKKKLINEIQYLNEEYKKEKMKYRDLCEKINQKKLKDNMLPNFTNNSDVIIDDTKKNKEYISYLENSIGKLEKENKELIAMLNTRKQETESQSSNYNYEEEQYYKIFIKNEINRLKELLSNFNQHAYSTHNQFYLFNNSESNFTKESKYNEPFDKNLSYFDENDFTNTDEEPRLDDKNGNNANNNKHLNQKSNTTKKNDFPIPNNNTYNSNKYNNLERNSNNSNEFVINSTSQSGINNKQKTKSKLKYGNINNQSKPNNNFKSQRTNSRRKNN
jgi:hypothetical protein